MLRVLSVLVLALAVSLAGTPVCRCLSLSTAQPAPEEHGCCSTGGTAQLASVRCCGGLSATAPATASLEQPTQVASELAPVCLVPEPAGHLLLVASETPPRLAPFHTSPILRI